MTACVMIADICHLLWGRIEMFNNPLQKWFINLPQAFSNTVYLVLLLWHCKKHTICFFFFSFVILNHFVLMCTPLYIDLYCRKQALLCLTFTNILLTQTFPGMLSKTGSVICAILSTNIFFWSKINSLLTDCITNFFQGK